MASASPPAPWTRERTFQQQLRECSLGLLAGRRRRRLAADALGRMAAEAAALLGAAVRVDLARTTGAARDLWLAASSAGRRLPATARVAAGDGSPRWRGG